MAVLFELISRWMMLLQHIMKSFVCTGRLTMTWWNTWMTCVKVVLRLILASCKVWKEKLAKSTVFVADCYYTVFATQRYAHADNCWGCACLVLSVTMDIFSPLINVSLWISLDFVVSYICLWLWICIKIKDFLQCFDIVGWMAGRASGLVICLERGANDLHVVQLIPLPPHHPLLQ